MSYTGPVKLQEWDGETLFGGFARVLTMAPVGTRAPQRVLPDRTHNSTRVTGVRKPRKLGLPEDRPPTMHDWTLVDQRTYNVERRKGPHLKVRCKCGIERMIPSSLWNPNKMRKRCLACAKKARRAAFKIDDSVKFDRVIIPYRRVAGE